MTQLWKELETVLSEMLELYRVLLILSKEKRDMLVQVQVQDIDSIVKQEEAIILQIGKLEGRRERLTAEIAKAGQVTEKITLAGIREMTDGEQAERLAELERKFDALSKELIPLNQLNTELIQQSLGFINYNLNLLTHSQVGPTYAAQGHQPAQSSPLRALVDRKV